MGIEGPNKPQKQEAPLQSPEEIEAQLEKIEEIREKFGAAEAEGRVTPETVNLMEQIEEKEKELKSQLAFLEGMAEMIGETNLKDVPEEKADWYLGTISKSYEEAQQDVKNGAAVGSITGAALMIGGIFATAYGLSHQDLQAMEQARSAMMAGGTVFYGTAAVAGLGWVGNVIRAKVASWREDRRFSKEWEAKRKEGKEGFQS